MPLRCICDFGAECGGLGTLQCKGCGGDCCVCICGGEDECPGCDFCRDNEDWGDDELGEAGA